MIRIDLPVAVATLSRKMLVVAGLTTALFAPMPSKAQEQFPPRVMALLPDYCKYTYIFRDSVPGGNNPAQWERWMKLTGGMFAHMHHYCFGLINTNNAKFFARTRQQRMNELTHSIGQFDYVIKNATPAFALLPEILTKKGENLIRLDKAPEGIRELERAIELKADYWPPYTSLSDYYKETGNLAKAREWVEKGLSVMPNSKVLQNRLAELGEVKGKRHAETRSVQRRSDQLAPKSPAEQSAARPDSQLVEPQAPAER